MTSTDRYRSFFLDSQEGTDFIKALNERIDNEHQSAEKNPELARDHTQRAKGIRVALEQINIVTSKARKGRLL